MHIRSSTWPHYEIDTDGAQDGRDANKKGQETNR